MEQKVRKMKKDSEWLDYLKEKRNNKTFYEAMLSQYRKCWDEEKHVCREGLYETKKDNKIIDIKGNKRWLKFNTTRKNGYRIHISNMEKNYRKCIRAYVSFLRVEGIEDKEEMLYYVIHFTFFHISFLRKLNINYQKTKKIINEEINWILRKDIEEVEFNNEDNRMMVAPKIDINGNELSKSDKMKQLNKARTLMTDRKIAEKYNPELTDKENCDIIGIKLRRLQQWKKKQREESGETESKIDKIKRLYNPNISLKKNCEIIDVSLNTLKKYLKEIKIEIKPIVIEQTDEVDDLWLDEMLESSDY